MKEISRRGGSMPAKELYPFVEANVKLTEWELEPAGKNKYIRWTNSFQFYSINYAKAGLIIKQKGMWYLTPEGEAALKLTPEEVMEKGEVAYREWRKLNPREDKRDEEPTDENAERDRAEELNLLESDAREGIRQFIVLKSPYEFQDMVAALLRAMGYHTPFIAPKGKDGGIDIIAYLDPLGAQTPRIKVQVKHKPDTAIGASEVRALSGILKAGDIALFVTSGTYSADARNAASGNDKFIRLIDGNDFIDMWQEYYDKMTDDDKNMLPLKRIAFLGNNE
ncbi:MAG: Mrr restriction system protein [Bacteroidaceae bacterium]|nr:Mrr restriction system protein [Bacteroidaceae bacterium]